MSEIEVPSEANAGQQIELTEMLENVGHRDPLYLFLCHLEWHNRRNLAGYQELLAALDDNDSDIRMVAEVLLHRSSPRFEPTERTVEAW
jgi:hypothetical protein